MKEKNVFQTFLFKKSLRRSWGLAAGLLLLPTLALSCFGRNDELQKEQIQAIQELSSTVESFEPRIKKINENSAKLLLAKQRSKLAVLQAKQRVNKTLKKLEETRLKAQSQRLEKSRRELTSLGQEKTQALEEEAKKVASYLQRLSSSKEVLSAQVKKFLQERQIVQGNHELSLLGSLVQEARINQFSSWIAEIALYVIGFKWFWGMFTGYKSTFIHAADMEVQQLYSSFSGRNTILENTNPDLVASHQKIVNSALEVQGLLEEMRVFSNLLTSQETETIKSKLNELSLDIVEKVDKLREQRLSFVDQQRSALEVVETLVKDASAALLDNIKKRTPDKLKEYTQLMRKGASLLASLFDNYKTQDRLDHMLKMSFKEASSYPLNFLTSEFGFIEPSTYQEFRLKEFREFKSRASESLDLINTRIKIGEKEFEKVISSFKNPPENSPLSKLREILLNAKKLLQEFVSQKETPTFKGIAQTLEEEINQLFEPFKTKIEQKVTELRQKVAEERQKQQKITELTQRIREEEKEFDEIRKRVLNLEAQEVKLEELTKTAKQTLESMSEGV